MNIKRGLIRRWNKWTSPFVRLFALCFKRDETLVIYGGALDLFIDNTKYLFIYNNSHHPEYKHIWLTRKQQTFKKLIELGYCVVKSNSFRGLYYTLTAGTVFYDNQINDFTTHNLTTGAKRIELWHGLPLKLWGVALTTNVRPYNPKSLLVEKLYKRHSWGEYCVSTSKKLHDIYSYSFEIPLQNVILSTNPRVSILLMDEQNRLDFIARYEQKKLQLFYTMLKSNQNRKIVYMPTFRDQDKFYINKAIPNWEKLNDTCKEHNISLYLKVHRMTPMPDIHDFSNISILDNEMDIYPLLPHIDILITDYSSIMYDFSLMKGKRTILYTFDIDTYSKQSRPLYEDFWLLRERLTNVNDFEAFLQALYMDKVQIKEFPIDEYYDNPNDIDSINKIWIH